MKQTVNQNWEWEKYFKSDDIFVSSSLLTLRDMDYKLHYLDLGG